MEIQTTSSASTLKHSRAGIASFVISWVAPVGIVSLFSTAMNNLGSIAVNKPNPLFGIVISALFLLPLGGVILGVIGILQKNTKKSFAWWGTIVNSFIVLIILWLLFT